MTVAEPGVPMSEITLVAMRILEAEPHISWEEAEQMARALIVVFGRPS